MAKGVAAQQQELDEVFVAVYRLLPFAQILDQKTDSKINPAAI